MTISPIGPNNFPIKPQEENLEKRTNPIPGQTQNSQRIESATHEHVEISPEARHISRLQSDITRLQIIEHALAGIIEDISHIEKISEEFSYPQQDSRADRTQTINEAVKEHLDKIEQKLRETYLDGRPISKHEDLIVSNREHKEKIPLKEMVASVNRFVKEAGDISRSERKIASEQIAAQLQNSTDKIRQIRTGLENEVREYVAGFVRESSKSRPKDVEDAERLIRETRPANSDQDRLTKHIENIAQKAVRLLR